MIEPNLLKVVNVNVVSKAERGALPKPTGRFEI